MCSRWRESRETRVEQWSVKDVGYIEARRSVTLAIILGRQPPILSKPYTLDHFGLTECIFPTVFSYTFCCASTLFINYCAACYRLRSFCCTSDRLDWRTYCYYTGQQGISIVYFVRLSELDSWKGAAGLFTSFFGALFSRPNLCGRRVDKILTTEWTIPADRKERGIGTSGMRIAHLSRGWTMRIDAPFEKAAW